MPVWFSVEPLNPDDGTRTTLRFCNKDDVNVTGVNDEEWWPGIGKAPSLNFEAFNGSFQNAVAIANASLSLNLAPLRKADTNAPAYRYAAAPVTVWHFEDPADFDINAPIAAMLVTDCTITDGVMQLSAAVDSEPFAEDFLTAKYAGTGGAEGGDDLKGKSKPAIFGYAQNIEPVMLDAVNNVYQVHGYGAIEDIPFVYERAADFGASSGDYASYAALVAASIPEGHWGTCLAEGMFRLGAPPFGLITADVKGDNVGGFHQSTAEVVQRLCDIQSVDSARIDGASLTAFATACPEPIDIYVTTPVSLMDLLQELVLPCNAQATLSWTGKLQFTRFGVMPTTAVLTLDAQGRELPPVTSNAELSVSPPYWHMEMEANRCWRVQSKDEIAFLDAEAAVPITVYRRYPVQPPTPTGDNIPTDWSATPPDYVDPVNVDTFDQFGPVWMSTATQTGGTTSTDGWTAPVLQDSLYPGWHLISQNVGNKVQGETISVKAKSDFDPDADQWPYVFINQSITGPWQLTCKVRGAGDRVAIGVIPYDPNELNGGYGTSISGSDVKDGFYIAQNDQYVVRDYDGVSFTSLTGVFIYQDYDPSLGLSPDSHARMLNPPVGDCELKMVFNGETVEHYINGDHVRTHFINNSFEDLMTYWAVFIPASPNAEIYDIQWAAATQARELDFRLDYASGPLRRMKDQNGWELHAPEITDGSDFGGIASKTFSGAAYAKAKIGGVSGASATSNLALPGVGYIRFSAAGTWEMFRTAGGTLSVGTGSWSPGDEFGISYDRKKIKWYKNGAKVHDRKLNPPSNTYLFLDLGAGASFYDIDLTFQQEGELTLKGTQSNGALLTPISDTSPHVTGSFVALGETPDVVYSIAADSDTVNVTAVVRYQKTAGAAADVTLQAQLQMSGDGGASWGNFGSPATGPASTTTVQQVTVQASESISSSGSHRYRVIVQNLTAGTFTATISGTILAEWVG
jgi:hypothetical protein